MSTHILQSRPARASTTPAPALVPARSFAARDAAGGAAAPAGHEFGRVSVGAPPIQRVKKHHPPTKKKYLPKAVGKKQVAVSTGALAIKKAAAPGQQISNKEAARIAKAQL